MAVDEWWRRVPEVVGWLTVAGAGIVMISQAVGGPTTRVITIVQSLTPFVIVAVVAVAVVAVSTQRHGLAFVGGLVGASGLVLAAPLVFPSEQAEGRPGAEGLRAAAVNLLYSNDDVAAVGDALEGLELDVIVFTEFTAEHGQRLHAHELASAYPHRIERDEAYASGMAIWSKLPLDRPVDHETVNHTLDTTVAGPDGDVRVIGVHPPTPIYDHDDWLHDLAAVDDVAAAVEEPTLILGDFNASWWHPEFRRILRRGFDDAHIALGRGWSASWPTDTIVPAYIRLDHALTNDRLVATEVDDFDVPGSDHEGFVVTVVPAR